jgi:drug/metabolite transporter (DMT)-like permease
MLKVFAFVALATIVEASGDAIIRISLHSNGWPARLWLFAIGTVLLAAYGTFLNLAPVDFATVTGVYVALLFISFQISNYIFFKAVPQPATLVGGAFIICGGAIIYFSRS